MEKEKMSRQDFIDGVVAGDIIAFRDDRGRMFSAKVVKLGCYEGRYMLETKNGSVYYIKKEQIKWVRKERGWPEGIYNAFMKDKVAPLVEDDIGEETPEEEE